MLDCRPRRHVRHLSSVLVVTITRIIPIMFGSTLFLFTMSLVLTSTTSCIVLLLIRVAWSRCVIRLLQFKNLQYVPDMSLVRLDRDVVATPLDDPVQRILLIFSESAASPIWDFLISYVLDVILVRSSTADRSPPIVMSSSFTDDTICSLLMQPCYTRMDTRSLSST